MQTVTAPRLKDLLDARLLAALSLVGLLGALGWDRVNRKFDTRFFPTPAKAAPTAWLPGTIHEVGITVVTKDADRLACADDRVFNGAHCEFTKDKQRWPTEEGDLPDDNGAKLIVPYRTDIGAHLLFVYGLWDTPAMAFRRHREPSRAIPEYKLKRFVAHCELEFVGVYSEIELRWDYVKPWYTEHNAPVAYARNCFIE